jgi:putative oxidoreductase
MSTVSRTLESYADWSVVPLRIALALPMLVHGLGNVGVGPAGPGSIGQFAQFLDSQGLPLASVFAVVVTITEVGGGAAVLLGVLTRYAAAAIAIDMLLATLVVHVPNGYLVRNGGVELALTLFLIAVAIVITGAGERLSLERAVTGTEV